jgi:hypothetical protein
MAAGSNEHLRFALALEQRASTAKGPRLRANLLKLAQLHRELAERVEHRARLHESRARARARARRAGQTNGSRPG